MRKLKIRLTEEELTNLCEGVSIMRYIDSDIILDINQEIYD